MPLFVVESYDFQVVHGGRSSDGVVGRGGGSEKIYLHVLELAEGELAQLVAREDEHGNTQSDRRALPRNEEWWIAVDGDKVWPKTTRPALASRCVLEGGKPKPAPLSEEEVAALRKVGASLP